ncbi:MAG: 30S ribosomal protein S15 [Bacteroidetes bacterium]|nr:30S ribosomal protein S15 [Bacteroidota bacterium]
MYLTTEKKKEFFKGFGKSEFDTGSTEGQIALFTFRIAHLTDHLKENKKDLATERSLIRLVGKRRKLLEYLKDNDIDRYRAIIKKLKIRK